MKAKRPHDYYIDDYGRISFIKSDGGVFRVFWTRAGESTGQTIAWLRRPLKPTTKLALFYCQMACAIEDGFDRYHYYEKRLTPPKRIFRQP